MSKGRRRSYDNEDTSVGLGLILDHQYIGQIEKVIREAIFCNVGTIISFRIGAKDAAYLSREFQSVFSESDLVNLPNYRIYLKLLIDGFTSQAFSTGTLGVTEMRVSYRNGIVEASRRKYGKLRNKVERQIDSM